MPATSEKQKKFMDAVAHNKGFAKKVGVPQSVGADFSEASKGMTFKGGPRMRPDLQKVNEPKTLQGKSELFKKGGDTMASKMNPGFMAMIAKKKAGAKADMPMKKGGAAKKMAMGGSASARADGVATKGKTKGKMLAKGGMSKAKC